MTYYIDSHAHLTSPEILPLLEGVLQRAYLAGVRGILNICTDMPSLKAGLELAKSAQPSVESSQTEWTAWAQETKMPWVKNAGATTPHDVVAEGESAFPLFAKAAYEKQLCAIGETGLDYHYAELPKKMQQTLLVRYLHLAQEVGLPVIFHCREAFSDLFTITDLEYRGKAILHCFTGSIEEAEKVIERGWHLSLSGIVTFKNSEMLREVAKFVPLEQLLVETDAPYLAPQSRRGKQNEPAFIVETAACIAAAKGIAVEKVAEATCRNAGVLFGWPG